MKRVRTKLVMEIFEEIIFLADKDLRVGQIMKIVESRLTDKGKDLFNVEHDVLLEEIKGLIWKNIFYLF